MRASAQERRHYRQQRDAEQHRRRVVATLQRIGARYCSCQCGRWADDIWVQPDGSAVPMSHHCAKMARCSAEAIPA